MTSSDKADAETIAVYDARVGDYTRMTERTGKNPALVSFMELVRPGGKVLDLGCGPGNSAAILRQRGFDVEAVDASAAMVQAARETHGVAVRQATFEDNYREDAYDGIWANFSLLHAPRERFADLLAKFSACLREQGVFHLGTKLGTGDARDRLGRYYAYYSRDELMAYFHAAGLTPVREFTGEGAGLSGETAPWIEIQARRSEKNGNGA